MKKYFPSFLFVLIIGLGAFLRLWRYAEFPVSGETADESAWTLLGASLIQERVPTSWSYFEAYRGYEYKEGVYNAPIVRPVLDHPPLFSLLPGAVHSLKHDWIAYPSMKLIRAPLILLGIINLILFWKVAEKYFKKPWSTIASLLYATLPMIVFGSRLVVAENLLITWVLLALLVVRQKKYPHRFLALSALSALAVLTKIAGIILPGALILYGLVSKQKDEAKAGFWGGLIGASLFALYGAWYNWELFLALIFSQSSRELGLATLQNRLFLNPAVVEKVFFSGWKIVGLIATAFLLANKKKRFTFVGILTVTTLLFIVLSSGEQTLHGWYDYIMFPSFVIAITVLFKDAFKEKSGLLFGLLWLLLLPIIRLGLVGAGLYDGLSRMTLRGLMLIGFLPIVFHFFTLKKLKKILYWGLIFVLVLANIVTVFQMTAIQYWENAEYFSPTVREK